MMAIGIASIMPHACGGMILHVLIVIIHIKAPTNMSQIPPYQHHPVCLSGFNVGRAGRNPGSRPNVHSPLRVYLEVSV